MQDVLSQHLPKTKEKKCKQLACVIREYSLALLVVVINDSDAATNHARFGKPGSNARGGDVYKNYKICLGFSAI